jgi:hypothetical protein
MQYKSACLTAAQVLFNRLILCILCGERSLRCSSLCFHDRSIVFHEMTDQIK